MQLIITNLEGAVLVTINNLRQPKITRQESLS